MGERRLPQVTKQTKFSVQDVRDYSTPEGAAQANEEMRRLQQQMTVVQSVTSGIPNTPMSVGGSASNSYTTVVGVQPDETEPPELPEIPKGFSGITALYDYGEGGFRWGMGNNSQQTLPVKGTTSQLVDAIHVKRLPYKTQITMGSPYSVGLELYPFVSGTDTLAEHEHYPTNKTLVMGYSGVADSEDLTKMIKGITLDMFNRTAMLPYVICDNNSTIWNAGTKTYMVNSGANIYFNHTTNYLTNASGYLSNVQSGDYLIVVNNKEAEQLMYSKITNIEKFANYVKITKQDEYNYLSGNPGDIVYMTIDHNNSSGILGLSGYSGYSGQQGSIGTSGYSGFSGTSGLRGHGYMFKYRGLNTLSSGDMYVEASPNRVVMSRYTTDGVDANLYYSGLKLPNTVFVYKESDPSKCFLADVSSKGTVLDNYYLNVDTIYINTINGAVDSETYYLSLSNSISGFSGTNGLSGYSGFGTSGYSGYSGQQGQQGAAGTNGSSGYSGYSGFGTSGYSGYRGRGMMFRYSGIITESALSGQIGRHVNLANPYGIGHYTADGQNISGLLSGLSSGDLLYIYNESDASLAKLLQITTNSGGTDRNQYWTNTIYYNFGKMTANAIYYMTPYYVRAGADGSQGTSGFSGYSGYVTGIDGASGYSGYSGKDGQAASSGYSGYSGQQGTSGYSGAPYVGYSGYSGYSGKDGTASASGWSGYSGYSGKSGYSGNSGYSGAVGQQGLSGYSGLNGTEQGPSGYSGYSGQDGIIGQDGTSGYSGYSGKDGAAASSGYSGYSGANGTVGTSGYSGYSGQQGFQGIQGIQGQQGTSGYSGYSGTGTSGYSGYSGSAFVGSSGYSGYSGKDGAAASSGYSGYSGINGTSGYSGYSGRSGYSGTNGTVGTSGYSGYSGLQGNAGAGGTSGYSGYSGQNGISGYSGQNGTQKGDSGYSGYSGIDGASGYSGINGVSGYSGINGTSGYSGLTGADGQGWLLKYVYGATTTGRYNTWDTSGFDINYTTQGSINASGLFGTVKVGDMMLMYQAGVSTSIAYFKINSVNMLGSYFRMYYDSTQSFNNLTLTANQTYYLTPIYSGFSGTSGYSGIDGASGYSGINGVSGYSGINGTSGYSGLDGISGYSGINGISGYSGINGISGYSGQNGTEKGDSGYSGYSGQNGIIGVDGASGYSGYSGQQGTSGYSGITGADGQGWLLKYKYGNLLTGKFGYRSPDGFDVNYTTQGSINASGLWGTVKPGDMVLMYQGGVPTSIAYFKVSSVNMYSSYLRFYYDATQSFNQITLTADQTYYLTPIYTGISGYSGTNGVSGYSGYSGLNGISGYSGFDGYSGYSGQNGYSGYSGLNGSVGQDGISGYSGFSGKDGQAASSGYSGYSGQQGTSGYSGYSGEAFIGSSGYSGYSGKDGQAASSGYSGYSGSNGTVGTSGYSGTNGASGYSGYSGTGPAFYTTAKYRTVNNNTNIVLTTSDERIQTFEFTGGTGDCAVLMPLSPYSGYTMVINQAASSYKDRRILVKDGNGFNLDILGNGNSNSYYWDTTKWRSFGTRHTVSNTTGASNGYGFAIGTGAAANWDRGIAIGPFSTADGTNATAVGQYANAPGQFSLAIGNDANANEDYSIAIGKDVYANEDYTIVAGNNIVGYSGIAIGRNLINYSGIIFGQNISGTISYDSNNIAYGYNIEFKGYNSTYPSNSNRVYGSSMILDYSRGCTIVGTNINVLGTQYDAIYGHDITSNISYQSTILGHDVTNIGTKNVINGSTHYASGNYNTIYGYRDIISGSDNNVIGEYNDVVGGNNSLVGEYSEVYGNDNLVLGEANIHGDNNTAFGRNITIYGSNKSLYITSSEYAGSNAETANANYKVMSNNTQISSKDWFKLHVQYPADSYLIPIKCDGNTAGTQMFAITGHVAMKVSTSDVSKTWSYSIGGKAISNSTDIGTLNKTVLYSYNSTNYDFKISGVASGLNIWVSGDTTSRQYWTAMADITILTST